MYCGLDGRPSVRRSAGVECLGIRQEEPGPITAGWRSTVYSSRPCGARSGQGSSESRAGRTGSSTDARCVVHIHIAVYGCGRTGNAVWSRASQRIHECVNRLQIFLGPCYCASRGIERTREVGSVQRLKSLPSSDPVQASPAGRIDISIPVGCWTARIQRVDAAISPFTRCRRLCECCPSLRSSPTARNTADVRLRVFPQTRPVPPASPINALPDVAGFR